MGGKTEGMLQVLWERGQIDVNNLHLYTANESKDVFGIVQKATSLKYLLSNCRDFEYEESQCCI